MFLEIFLSGKRPCKEVNGFKNIFFLHFNNPALLDWTFTSKTQKNHIKWTYLYKTITAEHVKREWSDITEKEFSSHIDNGNRIINLLKITVKGYYWGYWGQKWCKCPIKWLLLDFVDFVTNRTGWLSDSIFREARSITKKNSQKGNFFFQLNIPFASILTLYLGSNAHFKDVHLESLFQITFGNLTWDLSSLNLLCQKLNSLSLLSFHSTKLLPVTQIQNFTFFSFVSYVQHIAKLVFISLFSLCSFCNLLSFRFGQELVT